MLARLALVASLLSVVVVLATFDLRYSGLLGPKLSPRDERSP